MTEQHEVLAKELENALNKFSENVNKIIKEMFTLEGKTEKDWNMKYQFKHTEPYFVLCQDGDIFKDTWVNHQLDENRFLQGSVFKTQEAAELESKRRNLLTRFRAFRDECNGDWKVDWNDNYQDKYFIKRANGVNSFVIETYYTVNSFNLFGYFKDYKDALSAIELFGDEIKKLFIDCECD